MRDYSVIGIILLAIVGVIAIMWIFLHYLNETVALKNGYQQCVVENKILWKKNCND